ncbi:hypothetical protein EVAR_24640_1 [Eumeta japonica]|uniref:Uncharacterized protein n=1 Tax=Eumeta variegata TaxID=151549 RepID=A0A4C1V2C9_EUMVA|nr:hypothetical protein EVAR_24640_1 [Eumeta japonica]
MIGQRGFSTCILSTGFTYTCCSTTATDARKWLQINSGASVCTHELHILHKKGRDHALCIFSALAFVAGDPEDSQSTSSIVTASSGSMMKWWVAAPSGPEKLDDEERRRSGKTTTITHFLTLAFVRGSSALLFLRVRVRDGGLMLHNARTSSRRGYDPDGPVVMAPFQGSKLEAFSRQPKIRRSCQWVHRHRLRPSRLSLGVMVKWWVTAPSGPEKLDDGES